ncbi:MAG TPA: hypothetical protein VEN31_08550 [Candidatus Bathyarchaeia archaeon]|nr:hypothetical protein [Candidatus Bathyarchaeia archaeon]
MPDDAARLLIGLALLIILAVGLGTLSARLFMSAARGPNDGTKGL